MLRVRVVSATSFHDLKWVGARLGLAPRHLVEVPASVVLLLTGIGASFLKALTTSVDKVAGGAELACVPGTPESGSALLIGQVGQLKSLGRALGADEMGQRFRTQLEQALGAASKAPLVGRMGHREFRLGERTLIMGVVNVTPDSFSDGGRFESTGSAIAHARTLIDAGADVIDVGGESTRPGAPTVDEATEMSRVLPVIEALAQDARVPVSVDTQKPAVARAALKSGASFVNDIGGLRDPEMVKVVAASEGAVGVMHMHGTPATMQLDPRYDDVVDEVLDGLAASVARAEAAGILKNRIWVDPGIGFGKTLEHNLFLLRRLEEFRVLGCPILIGTSRKSFLGKLLEGKPAWERVFASVGSAAGLAAMGVADMVRVHDVAETRDALAVVDAVRTAEGGGSAYRRG
ncbi:MAG: dihydropteroate synthase [Myxococcaceae bacterium]